MTNMLANALTWFSIPANDYEKSIKFFESLLEVQLIRQTTSEEEGSEPFAMFPAASQEGVTGAVIASDKYQPAKGGVVVYLLCKDLDGALGRVESLGGSIHTPKAPLPGMGHIAVIGDCDGTPIGLHQP